MRQPRRPGRAEGDHPGRLRRARLQRAPRRALYPAAPDKVIMHITFHGRHIAPFFGQEPTGKGRSPGSSLEVRPAGVRRGRRALGAGRHRGPDAPGRRPLPLTVFGTPDSNRSATGA
ncbi:hypothetical protein ACRAWF_12340 [Streptomyces sp. L7]